MEAPSTSQLRADGRTHTQLRALSCARGTLVRADGSARWCQGGTSVLAAAYGPIEAPTGRQDAERAVVEVVFRPRSGLAGPAQRDAESIVRQAVQGGVLAALHPRTIVQVVLQVEADDGGVLACAANAAGAALVDAGIPMSSQLAFIAIAAGSDGQLVLDPTAAEEACAAAVACFGYLATDLAALAEDGRAGDADVPVLLSHVRGVAAIQVVHDMLDAAVMGAERVAAFLRLSTQRDFDSLAAPAALQQ